MKSKREEINEHRFEQMKKELTAFINESVSATVQAKLESIVNMAVENKVNSILDLPLSVKQVALITGRSAQSIYKMCQREQIPYKKNGGVIHLSLRVINEILLSK